MVTVRETLKEEAQLLSEIQRQAFLPLYERYRDAGNPCLRGAEDVLKRLDTPSFRYFTILEDGEIAGGVLYKSEGSGPFFKELTDGEYYLQRVYVRPDRQGSGIARKAILLCEKELFGAVRFIVDFPVDLEKNRRCYEAAGFRDTGRRMEVEAGLVLACYEKWMK